MIEIRRGSAPLIVTLPHTGTDIPEAIAATLASPWLARKDTDWWIDRLYAPIAEALDATVIRTPVSRTVIDVNRDPSGASLYPGQATTELCPTTTFDGAALYDGAAPSADEVARRRAAYFDPFHAAIDAEVARLRGAHGRIVLYDAHSIRSRIPRLFDGELPHLNLGTNGGTTCAPELEAAIVGRMAASGFGQVVNGRFRGGWTVRDRGRPDAGVHAVQMELACRGYMTEPDAVGPDTWPAPFDPATAAPLAATLSDILNACLTFAKDRP